MSDPSWWFDRRRGGGGGKSSTLPAELYRAQDTRLGRDAAIKILRSDVASDALRRKRFEEEAKAASALNHPNIITIYQIGDFESSPFIAMELVDGTTLRERLEHGPLELSEVRHIARQLCEGLQKAHDSGVVHGDLKPDNIMVTRDGLVKIVDFGLAQLLGLASAIEFEAETLTKEASVTGGTLAYMAPEQALGKPQDGRSDLFSLGVVLYEITTGRKPFVGETVAAVFDAILHQAPSTAGLPAPLEPVILRCLEKKPDARFASALELQAAIAEDTSAVPTTDELSIAVVPFKNLSTDQDAEFFCDGLTEDITLDLAKVGNLRVISRTSAKQLKDSEKDLRAQGRELGVQYVLEGSVRRAGANVRITAQLIHVETDAHVWGERFSGTLEDIFAIQEELSRKIVDALKLTLTPEEDRAFAERPFDDVRAYECYTRAHEEQWRWSKDGLERSLRLLDSGLEIIGDHELLYAAKGIVYWQFMVGGMQPRDSSFAEATRRSSAVFAFSTAVSRSSATMSSSTRPKESSTGNSWLAGCSRETHPLPKRRVIARKCSSSAGDRPWPTSFEAPWKSSGEAPRRLQGTSTKRSRFSRTTGTRFTRCASSRPGRGTPTRRACWSRVFSRSTL